MKVFVKILIISLLIISCQRAHKDKSQIRAFDLKELPKITDIKLSDLGLVNIAYIPLETNEQCVIDQIGSIKVGSGFLLVQSFNTILIFLYDGSFVTRIGNVGRGPNEFQIAHDVGIDNRNQNIYLVSGWQKKFNVYSKNGEFERTFKIPLYAAIHFQFTEENEILCYSDNYLGNIENSFVLMDTVGAIIKNFPNRFPFKKNPNYAPTYQHENLFYRFNNRLYKKEVYSDTVYVYENMNFKPHLVIEVGNRLVTPEARAENDLFYLSKNYITPLNLFEFGDFIYYEFIYERILGTNTLIFGFIGSKKNKFQAFINSEQGLINDLDGGPNIWPKTTKDDNTIITWIDASKLKDYVASDTFKKSTPKYPEKKKELEKLANSIQANDNPIIIMIKVK
jgi:hypothetical protein